MIASLLSRIGIEVWRDIPNYENNYQVSNLGNVRSIKFNKKNKLKIYDNINKKHFFKRKQVALCMNGIKKNIYVHQLVAMAFLNHIPCGYDLVVDHINNNSLDNKLYNLQLVTQRKNVSKDKKGNSKYTGVSFYKRNNTWISHIKINGNTKHLGYFKTEKEAAQAYQKELTKIKQL